MTLPPEVWNWMDLAIGAGLGFLSKALHGWVKRRRGSKGGKS